MAKPYWWTLDDEVGLARRPATPRKHGAPGSPATRYDAESDGWAAGEAGSVAASCSDHARLRRAQRNLQLNAVSYVLAYGALVCRTGATFHILRHCDIDPNDLRRDDIARLEGAVVLIENDTVITMYRNRRSYHQIHKKEKYVRSRPAGGRGAAVSHLAA